MINQAGLALIREFEGCRLRAYLDTLANPAVWTIGYGQTGPDVVAGTVWTQAQADARLLETVEEYADSVRAACKVVPNANQHSAMTSLAYNIGRAAFTRSSVLRLHNDRKFAEAAQAFSMWNKAGGRVRAGLTRRRAAEAALYLTPAAGEAQTTRAEPEARDPNAGPPTAAIAAGAGAVLTCAQQAVAQVSSIWDGLGALGISPHVLISALGVAVVGTLAWFLWREFLRRREGNL